MKVVLLLCAIFFLNCSMFIDTTCTILYSNKGLYDSVEFDCINSIQDIAKYYNNNGYYYKADIGDYCKTPKEMVNDKYGDCEDYAVLFLNICKVRMNIEGSLIVVNLNDRAIVSGGFVNHVMVVINGRVYEPQNGSELSTYEYWESRIGYIYSFGTIFGGSK